MFGEVAKGNAQFITNRLNHSKFISQVYKTVNRTESAVHIKICNKSKTEVKVPNCHHTNAWQKNDSTHINSQVQKKCKKCIEVNYQSKEENARNDML